MFNHALIAQIGSQTPQLCCDINNPKSKFEALKSPQLCCDWDF